MEILEYIAGAFLVVAVLSVVLQLAMSYALQTLADKNGLPEFARFLSWVPLLNVYPAVAVSGMSFKKFLLGIVGFVVAIIGLGVMAGMLGDGFGPIASAGCGFLLGLGALYYVGLLLWKTAERRGLPGFIGLLALIPFFGLFAYAYIAFHDGWSPVNKAGFALGFILAVGPLVGQYQMMQTMGDTMAQLEMDQEGTGEISDASMEQMMADLGAVAEIGIQLAMAESLDPSVPEQAAEMRRIMAESKQTLNRIAPKLGPEGTADLQTQIANLAARLPASADDASAGLGQPISAPMDGAPMMGLGMEIEGGAAPVQWANAGDEILPVTAGAGYDEQRGFDVPPDVACPEGTVMRGSAPPAGYEQWCEATDGLKHGWYTEWHDTGFRKAAGEFHEGMRVGIWTRWFPDGMKRAQAEFERGLQEGRLIAWDRTGHKVRELRFTDGEVASR